MMKQAPAVPIRFGGDDPAGWLPMGAARPLPTPQVTVLLDIVLDGDEHSGCSLSWAGPTAEYSGDRWSSGLKTPKRLQPSISVSRLRIGKPLDNDRCTSVTARCLHTALITAELMGPLLHN